MIGGNFREKENIQCSMRTFTDHLEFYYAGGLPNLLKSVATENILILILSWIFWLKP